MGFLRAHSLSDSIPVNCKEGHSVSETNCKNSLISRSRKRLINVALSCPKKEKILFFLSYRRSPSYRVEGKS